MDEWNRYLGAHVSPETYAKRGGNEDTLVDDLKHLWGDPNQGEDYLTNEKIRALAKQLARQLPSDMTQ